MLIPIADVPEIDEGADLAALLVGVLAVLDPPLGRHDVLVLAQKIVSKAESRYVDLRAVAPSPRAVELAAVTRQDPRLVEVILSESCEVVRAVPDVLITRHRLGFVMAQAGVDRSNLPHVEGAERVLLLPLDPQRSAENLRASLERAFGFAPAVVISDSFGRPWRVGVVNVALGAAGIAALWDRRGEADRHGRALQSTQVAWADAVAAAAGLVMGEAGEGTPVVLVRGLPAVAPPCAVDSLIRPLSQDLFR